MLSNGKKQIGWFNGNGFKYAKTVARQRHLDPNYQPITLRRKTLHFLKRTESTANRT